MNQVFHSFNEVYVANGGTLSGGMGVFNGQQEREIAKRLLGEILYIGDERMAHAKWRELVPLVRSEAEEISTTLTDPSSDAQQKEAGEYMQWIRQMDQLLLQQGTTMEDLLTQDFDLS